VILLQARWARVGSVVLAAIVVALVGGLVLVGSAQAQAPAHWRPLLMADAAEVRVAPRLEPGSSDDRAELDQIVAEQAGASFFVAQIEYWTAVPSPVRWNEILLAAVRDANTNPVRVSRTLGLLNAAMYDAIIATWDTKIAFPRSTPSERDSRIEKLAPPDDLSSHASVDAAIASAAVAVLSEIYPDRSATFEARLEEVLAVRRVSGAHTPSDVTAGAAIGEAVGALAVERARTDGGSAVWQGTAPEGPGYWVPALASRNDQPIEPLAGTWRPWLLESGSELRPGPPPAYLSEAWQAEADEVVRVNEQLTDEQVRIARFWADGAGTDTPPGHWMRIAIELTVRDELPLASTARVLTHLAIAQADAFIACWDAKFTYWSGRPTALIPGFASTVITPNFPSYTSGHATLSGASAEVLAAFFPSDREVLMAQGDEATTSRLYGGIHWRSDNEVGFALGQEIGKRAIARATADGNLR